MHSSEIFRNLSKDESILFKIAVRKANYYKKKFSTLFIIFMLINCLILIIGFDLFYRRRIIITSFDIFTIIMMIFMTIMGYFVFFKMGSKSIDRLIITDRHIYKQHGRSNTASIESMDLNSLKALSFHSRKFDKKKQLGTIKFVPEVRIGKSYALKFSDIPDFFEFQKIIESIVFHYCDIENRWELIRNKLNIRFPHSFTISGKKKKV